MVNNDKKVVGKRIHKIRKALKMNQSEFGKKINVTQKSVSEMENGISTPSFETLKKMLLGYNVNIIWVINGNGNMFLNRVEAEGNKKICFFFGICIVGKYIF